MKPYCSVIADIQIRKRNLVDVLTCKFHAQPLVISSKICWVPLLGVLFSMCLPGTTIAILRTPDHIIIGVDSKVTMVYSEGGTNRIEYGISCKIIRRGQAIYVGAGMALGVIDAIDKSAVSFDPRMAIPVINNILKNRFKNSVALIRVQDPN
jgi:hypothetical protein